MFSSIIPAARVARLVEIVRHHLGQLQQRMVPPPIAVMEMVMNAWGRAGDYRGGRSRHCRRAGQGSTAVDELASAVDADADAVSRLLRALATRGLFRLRRDGRYELTPLGDCLRSDAEVSLRGLARFVGSARASRALEPSHRCHSHRASRRPGLAR